MNLYITNYKDSGRPPLANRRAAAAVCALLRRRRVLSRKKPYLRAALRLADARARARPTARGEPPANQNDREHRSLQPGPGGPAEVHFYPPPFMSARACACT